MNPAQTSLIGLQREDGGWSASSHGPSATEPTALAVMALRGVDDPASETAARRGIAWLRARQREDGSWPVSEQVPMASWMTALAALALAGHPAHRAPAVAGARWLLDVEGRPVPWFSRLFFSLFPRYNVIDLDLELKGWPWIEDTFGWVEPTAYALLALKTLRGELPASPTGARIEEGERLLLDRVCGDGGWNYGNSRVYDEVLWPYPDTTALALLALQDRPGLPQVEAGFQALDRMLADMDSVLAASLALICHRVYRRPPNGLSERIEARLEADPPWVDVRALALAGLALRDATPFALGEGRRRA